MLATHPPPIISLASPDKEQLLRDIDEACSTWGAFVVVDHGIPTSVLQHVLSLGHQFFDLPLDTKEKYNLQDFGAKWRGYMPLGGERSAKGTTRDLKEGLYMGDEHPSDHPCVVSGLPTFGSNVFPSEEEVPGMRDAFLSYHEQMKDLGNRMMRLLSLALDLDEDYIEEHVTEHDPVILPRMFRYEKQEAAPSPRGVVEEEGNQEAKMGWGIGRHSDYGLWTMILTDSPGLEFQHPTAGTWHEVPFVESGIIVNVGDVLDRLTCGRYISAYHRARNPSSTKCRLSLPFFYDPSWTARMQCLPIADVEKYDSPDRAARWAETNISCIFNGELEYSEFLAKKVAKVFPDLVPEEVWKTLKSTSQPSTRHALVVQCPDVKVVSTAIERVKEFYLVQHPEIKASHGWEEHVSVVYDHTKKALLSLEYTLPSKTVMEIKLAALLHDLDDRKYFPKTSPGTYPNASAILESVGLGSDDASHDEVIKMISWVGCSENGNSVPKAVKDSEAYHLLIPRWADRLEAVGSKGVVRCFQYNQENGRPLWSEESPRPKNEEELWKNAPPSKLQDYMDRGGTSADMISHYYDKLLHIACPPKDIVRNPYLEEMAETSSKDLVEVCLRFGKSGKVDQEYILRLMEGI